MEYITKYRIVSRFGIVTWFMHRHKVIESLLIFRLDFDVFINYTKYDFRSSLSLSFILTAEQQIPPLCRLTNYRWRLPCRRLIHPYHIHTTWINCADKCQLNRPDRVKRTVCSISSYLLRIPRPMAPVSRLSALGPAIVAEIAPIR